MITNVRSALLSFFRNAAAAALICSAAGAQTIPKNGDTFPVGTVISLPCSCSGNACALWPIPDSLPGGFTYGYTKQTSFLEKGEMRRQEWQTNSGIGGTYVQDPWNQGKCVAVSGSSAVTEDEPKPVTLQKPGTYLLTITTQTLFGVADCGHPTCAGVKVRNTDRKEEKRIFTVTDARKGMK